MARRRFLAAFVLAVSVAGAGVGRAEAAAPTKGVVLVTTNLALQSSTAAGTGIVLTRDGEVLTNNHVIRGATTIKVIVPKPRRTYTATVEGYSIVGDVALLKLNGASGLATVTRGKSATLRVGSPATAVGNANGGGRLVVTKGRITALNRTIQIRDDSGDVARLGHLIETTARLVPGDSGGPLLDGAGRVVGMNAAGSASFAFQASDGYAIPIDRALAIAGQIDARRGSATVHVGPTAFIGLQLDDAPSGIAIAAVVPGSPAEQSGLQAGDTITAVNGKAVTSFVDVRTALFRKHPGDTITLGFVDVLGNETSATLVLATGPPQ